MRENNLTLDIFWDLTERAWTRDDDEPPQYVKVGKAKGNGCCVQSSAGRCLRGAVVPPCLTVRIAHAARTVDADDAACLAGGDEAPKGKARESEA